MERFIGRSLVLGMGVYLSLYLVKGVVLSGFGKEYWLNFALTVLLFYVFYFAIMPILKILTLPITFISFGLFYFVLMFGCIKIIDKYIDFITINNNLSLIAFAMIMSVSASLAKNL